MFGHLKINRAIAIRYDQLTSSFIEMAQLVTARYWLKFVHAVELPTTLSHLPTRTVMPGRLHISSVALAIGLIPRTTPVGSAQSNGMAEAFVRILKRDYIRVNPTPDARAVVPQLPAGQTHYKGGEDQHKAWHHR